MDDDERAAHAQRMIDAVGQALVDTDFTATLSVQELGSLVGALKDLEDSLDDYRKANGMVGPRGGYPVMILGTGGAVPGGAAVEIAPEVVIPILIVAYIAGIRTDPPGARDLDTSFDKLGVIFTSLGEMDVMAVMAINMAGIRMTTVDLVATIGNRVDNLPNHDTGVRFLTKVNAIAGLITGLIGRFKDGNLPPECNNLKASWDKILVTAKIKSNIFGFWDAGKQRGLMAALRDFQNATRALLKCLMSATPGPGPGPGGAPA